MDAERRNLMFGGDAEAEKKWEDEQRQRKSKTAGVMYVKYNSKETKGLFSGDNVITNNVPPMDEQ